MFAVSGFGYIELHDFKVRWIKSNKQNEILGNIFHVKQLPVC